MKKEDIIECINYFEAEVIRLNDDVNSLKKFNYNTSKTEKKIQNYKNLIQQFNRKLLNSSYKINQDLLAAILDEFETEAELLENSDLLPRNINLISHILQESKRNRAENNT